MSKSRGNVVDPNKMVDLELKKHEMQQRMMDRVKEQLEIAKDDEWSAIQPLVQKVFDARRETMANSFGRGFGRGPRPGAASRHND